ncbi:MAG: hypothetical protein R2860_08100 [Desulfobacterales bacterium]
MPDTTTRFDALASLCGCMDQAYDEIAEAYRFHCDGCGKLLSDPFLSPYPG